MGEKERRNVRALTVFNLLRGATVGGFMTLFPMYMRSIGYEMRSIGGIISVASVILALVLPLIGYLNDRYGPRRMIIASTIILAAAPALASQTTSLTVLGVAYGLFLLSFLAGQPARMSFLAASVDPARLGIAIGVTTGAFSASRTAGPAASGYLARYLGFQEAFLALTAMAIVSLAVFIALSEPVEIRRKPRNPVEAYRSLLRPPSGFRAVLGYVSLDRIAWSMWFPLISAHLYSYGYAEDQVGLLVTLSGLVQTLALPLAGKLTDRTLAYRVMAASDLLGIATAALLMTPVPLWRSAAAMSLLGLSIALWIPGYNTLIARIAGGTGADYAAANTARSLLSAPFPYVGGRLYDQVSPQAPFQVSMILMLGTVLVAVAIVARHEHAALASEISRPPTPVVIPGADRGLRGPGDGG